MRSGMSSSVDQSRSLSISRSEEEQSNGSGAADPSKRLSDSDSSTCFTQSLNIFNLAGRSPAELSQSPTTPAMTMRFWSSWTETIFVIRNSECETRGSTAW